MQFDFLHNRATGGSGVLTLTAVPNEPGLQHAFPASTIDRWVRYTIRGAIKRESGVGLLHNSSGTYTLERTLPQMTWDGASYVSASTSAVDFTGETVDIFCAPSAGGVRAASPHEATRLPSGGIRGRWPLMYNGWAPSEVTILAGKRIFVPVSWDDPGVIDRFSFHSWENTATAFRSAIYEISLQDGGPGRLLTDFGATAFSGTGIKHSAPLGLPIFLPGGSYYVGFQIDAGSINVTASQYGLKSSWLGITSGGESVAWLTRDVTYGAFGDESGSVFTDVTGVQPGFALNKS